MFSDADAAALYGLLNPWDGARCPSDAFYDDLVMAADAVLDVGRGTGSMLRQARESGHAGGSSGSNRTGDPGGIAQSEEDRGDGVGGGGTLGGLLGRVFGHIAGLTAVGDQVQGAVGGQ